MLARSLPLALLLATGCNGRGDTGGADTGEPAGERTLDSCETSFTADVPAFFQTYFRCVQVSVSGDDLVILTQDLPPHKTAYYPEDDPNWTEFDTYGGERIQNPFEISAQDFEVEIPLDPTPKGLTIDELLVDFEAETSPEEYRGAPLGVALDSVALFHGVAAPGDDIAQEEMTFDAYEGHPASGVYHYHSAGPGPLEVLARAGFTTSTAPGSATIELYGVMCDGTIVLGCAELDGSAPEAGDLDAQGGHVHDVTDAEGTTHFADRYHTHVCAGGASGRRYTPEIQYYQEGCDEGFAGG